MHENHNKKLKMKENKKEKKSISIISTFHQPKQYLPLPSALTEKGE